MLEEGNKDSKIACSQHLLTQANKEEAANELSAVSKMSRFIPKPKTHKQMTLRLIPFSHKISDPHPRRHSQTITMEPSTSTMSMQHGSGRCRVCNYPHVDLRLAGCGCSFHAVSPRRPFSCRCLFRHGRREAAAFLLHPTHTTTRQKGRKAEQQKRKPHFVRTWTSAD